ncbi:MAG: hypothetical protein LC105_01410 [Chitinophagales bacterium]|nr:hypothetical protein [Chitinophagales bacterium]
MEWSTVIIVLGSLAIICFTTYSIFNLKRKEKESLSKQNFEHNDKLEDKKQVNAKELICLRNAEQPKEDLSQKVAELNQIVKELNKKIKTADDTTKQELEKAEAKIEVYKETVQLLKNKPCTN